MAGFYNTNNLPVFQINNPTVFSPVDQAQNIRISDLLNYQNVSMGNLTSLYTYSGTQYGGRVTLPESATNPNTPYVLSIDELCLPDITFVTDPNPDAFSVGTGAPTGSFDATKLKTYYVSDFAFPWYFDLTDENRQPWVDYFQKFKGTYGFNQIPIDAPIEQVKFTVARGTAISYGFPLLQDNGGGYYYYTVYPNNNDYCNSPYSWDLTAASAVDPFWIDYFSVNAGSTRYPLNIFRAYDLTYDDFFRTVFPTEYNTPAQNCPKAAIRPVTTWPSA